MQPEELFSVVFILGMFMGVFIVYMGLRQRSEQLQMQHRERMAMIERGQIPLNEAPAHQHRRPPPGMLPASRSLSMGIIVVGLGLAIMTIISIAGDSAEVGVGVGGAIAILGGAFIARSLIVRPQFSGEEPVPARPPTIDPPS